MLQKKDKMLGQEEGDVLRRGLMTMSFPIIIFHLYVYSIFIVPHKLRTFLSFSVSFSWLIVNFTVFNFAIDYTPSLRL